MSRMRYVECDFKKQKSFCLIVVKILPEIYELKKIENQY